MNSNISTKIKIAIVDDSDLIRDCLLNCLTLWGYSVILLACNGKDFFNQLEEHNLPDICIVDINMPEMNGYETINILKKTWPHIKTIIFSMNIIKGQPGIINADAVLSKSAGITEIKGALQQLSLQKPVSSE